MNRYHSFEDFKLEVAEYVKFLFYKHLESGCISNEEYMRLYEQHFLYIAVAPSFLTYLLVGRSSGYDYLDRFFSNDKVLEMLDAHYKYQYGKCEPTVDIDSLFNDAVNDIWSRCLPPLKKAIDCTLWIDWEREFPVIKPEYRWPNT